MAIHSCLLAWRIPRRGEPGGLELRRSVRVRHDGSERACAGGTSPRPRRGEGASSRELLHGPIACLYPSRKPSYTRPVQAAPEASARSPGLLFTGSVPLRVITKKIALPQAPVYFLWFYDKQAAVAPIQFIVLLRDGRKDTMGVMDGVLKPGLCEQQHVPAFDCLQASSQSEMHMDLSCSE